MFSSTQGLRGYFLHVTVQKVVQHDGYQMRSFELFNSGLKGLLGEAKRFSQPTLQKYADAALGGEVFDKVLTKVLVGKNLTVDSDDVRQAIKRTYTLPEDAMLDAETAAQGQRDREADDREAAVEAEEARKERANRGGR